MIRALLTTSTLITTALSVISSTAADVSSALAIAAHFVKDPHAVFSNDGKRRMQTTEDLAAICDTLGRSHTFRSCAVMFVYGIVPPGILL